MNEPRWLAPIRFPDVGLMSMLASFFGLFYGFGMAGWHLYYPGSGVRLTFRLNVVAHTPRRGDKNLSHSEVEKASNPVLDSLIIAAEAALCNSFVSYLLYSRRENSLHPCPESAFAVLKSYKRYLYR